MEKQRAKQIAIAHQEYVELAMTNNLAEKEKFVLEGLRAQMVPVLNV
jgi:hypothetical protein